VLLLDETGTSTLGNRQAAELIRSTAVQVDAVPPEPDVGHRLVEPCAPRGRGYA
jgi:hypothetical protein